MSNLYFTDKNDVILLLKNIMIDNNLQTNVITSKKLADKLNNFYESIFEVINYYKSDIDKIKNYNYKEKFYKYKISLEKFIDKINIILNNNNNICNFKLIKSSIIPNDVELQKNTKMYQYNKKTKNVDVIFDLPSFNIFYNISTCKLDLYFKSNDYNFYFNISPDLVNNFKVNKNIFNEFLTNFNLNINKLKKKILSYYHELNSKLLMNNMNICDKE